MELVTDFFDTRNDPDQISVTPEEQKKLFAIHPATLSELSNEDGPIVWILMIPTTQIVMERFLSGKISEKQLLERTKLGDTYDAIYLCSASVLPEFQHKGLAKQVALDAINNIQRSHPIRSLFYWPFSDAGKALAISLARTCNMQLFERNQ
ncbi:MAG: GCN5-related N-acetyltransferase (GNAT)-like protein [Flavipsychrobacter sp.]|nr:GCN5-related N-acetyltransferase (GNAT)-like protein [Flavipsychrobacter sp.]